MADHSVEPARRLGGRPSQLAGTAALSAIARPASAYDGAVYDVDQDNYFPYQSGEPLAERLPPFVSLDLRVDKRYTFKRWWLETYIDLLNVVRGENPEGVQYNYDYTEEAYVRGLPFLPSIGLRAEVAL